MLNYPIYQKLNLEKLQQNIKSIELYDRREMAIITWLGSNDLYISLKLGRACPTECLISQVYIDETPFLHCSNHSISTLSLEQG